MFGDTANRYIVFPDPDVTRQIELKCAIRPGALPEQYSVEWGKRASPNSPVVLLSLNTFDIEVETNHSVPVQYRCRVHVTHTGTMNEETYPGPWTTIQRLGKLCHMLQSTVLKKWPRACFVITTSSCLKLANHNGEICTSACQCYYDEH